MTPAPERPANGYEPKGGRRLSWEPLTPTETFTLRSKTHTALILLAEIPEGWAFSCDAARLYGDVCGFSDCLGRRGGVIDPARFAASRDEALAAAIAVIRSRVPDKPLGEWLDSLAPDQPDLFGAAA